MFDGLLKAPGNGRSKDQGGVGFRSSSAGERCSGNSRPSGDVDGRKITPIDARKKLKRKAGMFKLFGLKKLAGNKQKGTKDSEKDDS